MERKTLGSTSTKGHDHSRRKEAKLASTRHKNSREKHSKDDRLSWEDYKSNLLSSKFIRSPRRRSRSHDHRRSRHSEDRSRYHRHRRSEYDDYDNKPGDHRHVRKSDDPMTHGKERHCNRRRSEERKTGRPKSSKSRERTEKHRRTDSGARGSRYRSSKKSMPEVSKKSFKSSHNSNCKLYSDIRSDVSEMGDIGHQILGEKRKGNKGSSGGRKSKTKGRSPKAKKESCRQVPSKISSQKTKNSSDNNHKEEELSLPEEQLHSTIDLELSDTCELSVVPSNHSSSTYDSDQTSEATSWLLRRDSITKDMCDREKTLSEIRDLEDYAKRLKKELAYLEKLVKREEKTRNKSRRRLKKLVQEERQIDETGLLLEDTSQCLLLPI